MIIDNKRQWQDKTNIKTVWDFMSENTKSGELNIVTGYFTISALHLLKQFEQEPKKFKLILGEIANINGLGNKIINLLQGDSSLLNVFKLNNDAKQAINFLSQDNVEVKKIDSNFCHAKAYIYNDSDKYESSYSILGSSNLTEAGLGTRASSNIELNIAEKGEDSQNFLPLLKWFNLTWNQSAVDEIIVEENDRKIKKKVKQYFIDCIANFYREYQPSDIYYKILYELFKDDIDATVNDVANKNIVRLEDTVVYNTLFNYQKKGVMSLINMLTKYNGAILADAVGLGKTFTALAVIKYFQNDGYTTLVLCPKKLEDTWQRYRYKCNSRFEQDKFDYEVRFHTDLQDERLESNYNTAKLSWIIERPKLLIVIDESHNLRNDKSNRYKYLLDNILNANKNNEIKVLELSATPINTKLLDVRNQFKLFVRGDDKGFKNPEFNIPSLESLFSAAKKVLDEWSVKDDRKISDLVKNLDDKFFNLTDKLVVARTRKMVEKSEGVDLGFPKKNEPNNIYLGISEIGDIKGFDNIYQALLASDLTAYRPSYFTKITEVSDAAHDQRQREMFLVKMMITMFLKRLESSWFSCKSTLENVLAYHKDVLDKVNEFLDGKKDVTIDGADENYNEDNDDNEDENFSIGKKNPIALSSLEGISQFKKCLEDDVEKLQYFVDNITKYSQQYKNGEVKDAKLEKLKEILNDKVNKSHQKVLIFTSYTDTAKYLYEQLSNKFPNKVACVYGSNAVFKGKNEKDFQNTLMRFAPYSKMYKEYDWSNLYDNYYPSDSPKFDRTVNKWDVSFKEWKEIMEASKDSNNVVRNFYKLLQEPVSILIATDCLSEGQNLQDAQAVINYDIHWNPVRLIQRFGRIDRIGSKNAVIDCYNFWPAQNYDSYLHLYKRINDRMSTMLLVGTEIQALDENLKKQIENNPIIDKNDEKLVKQLQFTTDDIEDNDKNFGLHDLSFENFRQDLIDFMKSKEDYLSSMPNGIYSGFKTVDSLFDSVPESIVALVGTPHMCEGAVEHKYNKLFLALLPINDNREENVKVFNKQEILTILRANINKKRNVPIEIDRGDEKILEKLKSLMMTWAKNQVKPQLVKTIQNLFVGVSVPSNNCNTIDEQFKPDNLDLITWEYISKK